MNECIMCSHTHIFLDVIILKQNHISSKLIDKCDSLTTGFYINVPITRLYTLDMLIKE